MMLKKAIGLVLFAAFFSSCIPNERVIYLQNKEDDESLGLDTLIQLSRQDYRLQPNDKITLSFFAEVPEAVAKFNLSGNVNSDTGGGRGQASISTYDLDKDGYIEINALGRFQASGYTLRELKLELERMIRETKGVRDILVRAAFAGIPYTMLGEISGQGPNSISKNEVTLIEAIAASGGLSINADRRHVQIIRQYPDGARIHEVDVTDRKLMRSKLYYIQPNDLIYIKPLKIRELGAESTGLQNFSIIISTISSAFVIVRLLNN